MHDRQNLIYASLLNQLRWSFSIKQSLTRKNPKPSFTWLVKIRKLIHDKFQFQKLLFSIRMRECLTLIPSRNCLRPNLKDIGNIGGTHRTLSLDNVQTPSNSIAIHGITP